MKDAKPHIFVLLGDLTQVKVDAIVYPTSAAQDVEGHLTRAMRSPELGFDQVYFGDEPPGRAPMEAAGEAYWVSLEAHGRDQGPFGVSVTAVVGAGPQSTPTPAIIKEASSAALGVALEALGEVQGRLFVRDAFSHDVDRALRPLARKWALKGNNKKAFEETSQAVAEVLIERGRRAQLEGRRMSVGFPALGTGSGYNPQVSALELVRAQVRGIVDLLSELPDEIRARVDVVLVAYNEQTYHHFLRARQDVLEAQWVFDEALGHFAARAERTWLQHPVDRRVEAPRTLALAEAIQRGECVLFVGSGLSSGVGMKSWQHLIEALLEDLHALAAEKGLEMPSLERASTEDYLDIAQWHAVSRTQTGSRGHEHYVNRFFGPEATEALPLSVAHYLLLSLPFDHIITTNYDDLIERTLSALRRPHARIVRDQDVPRTGRTDEVSVVKFHGHAFSEGERAREERAQADGTIVLTREEYDTFFHRHPAKALLLEGLLLNHHFFFVGYSLSDPDFRHIQNRVVHMLEGAQRKAFATTLDDHRHWARAQWEDKELAQIPFHEGSIHERVHAMWRWLDTLNVLVTGAPSTFLTDRHLEGEPHLKGIHENLVSLGEQAEAAWAQLEAFDAEQLSVLERIFDLLLGLGWRSEDHGRAWMDIWRAMAAHDECTRADRVRFLRKALAAADRSEDIAALRRELDPLEE